MSTWNTILRDAAHAIIPDKRENAKQGELADRVNLNCIFCTFFKLFQRLASFSADNKGAGKGMSGGEIQYFKTEDSW